jgi:hypothetical protein
MSTALSVITPREAFDFGETRLDLSKERDRELLQFVLSQALYGEATGVYCGKSLFAAGSMEAARFYLRQARQELNHLELFADIFRILELKPVPAHWVIRLLSAHNNYYPLKVMMEHAFGEGMVLDIFRDVLLQVLDDNDPRVPDIKKKLQVVCKEEEEHIAWGEKETRRLLGESPWLKTPFYGILEWQLLLAPQAAWAIARLGGDHPVMKVLPGFIDAVQKKLWAQAQALGIAPLERPGILGRAWVMLWGALLFIRSQFARSTSKLEKIYIKELGF